MKNLLHFLFKQKAKPRKIARRSNGQFARKVIVRSGATSYSYFSNTSLHSKTQYKGLFLSDLQ